MIEMDSDVTRWLEQDGPEYLIQLGLKSGQVLVDFGCNEGHYSIPAANVVGPHGRVYAIDQDRTAIDRLNIAAQRVRVNNIFPIISEGAIMHLEENSADMILIYDVLHYLSANERKTLYFSARSVLRKGGLLSVFPKHNKQDWPMWHLADMDIPQIIKEMEAIGFVLLEEAEKRLIHDELIEQGMVLNFIKPPVK